MELTNLRPEQRNEASVWNSFFESDGWKLFLQRFEPRIPATVSSLEHADSLQDLGKAQAKMHLLREVTQLKDIIEAEFLSAAEQVEPQEVKQDAGGW